MFDSSGQIMVNILYYLIQITDKIFTLIDDLCAILQHLHIPDIKRFLQRRIHIKILQKTVSLVHNMIVPGKICQINLIKLT